MKTTTSHLWPLLTVLCAALPLSGCQPTGSPPITPVTAPVNPVIAPPASTTESTPANVTVPPNTIFRVKAGRDTPFTDSEGRVWQPDQGFDGGDVADRDPGTKIAGTQDPEMFLTEHYGMNSFSCNVPNGNYTANLYFAETFDGITGPGDRVFSFNVQGQEFKDFDIWVKAGGPDHAYVVTVPVTVTNGVFRIDFTSEEENPEINAIEIIPHP